MKHSTIFGSVPNIFLALNLTRLLKKFLHRNGSLAVTASREWYCITLSFVKEPECCAC